MSSLVWVEMRSVVLFVVLLDLSWALSSLKWVKMSSRVLSWNDLEIEQLWNEQSSMWSKSLLVDEQLGGGDTVKIASATGPDHLDIEQLWN